MHNTKRIFNSILILIAIVIVGLKIYSPSRTIDGNNETTATLSIESDDDMFALGAGVFVNKDTILTANHVIIDGKIHVYLKDGSVLDGELISRDTKKELALIRVKNSTKPVTPAIVSCSNPLPGDQIYTIGNPDGIMRMITFGYMSSQNNIIRGAEMEDYGYIADISVFHGNSGGGVFERDSGFLTGIVSAMWRLEDKEFLLGRLFHPSRMSFMVKPEKICEFLRANDVSFREAYIKRFA